MPIDIHGMNLSGPCRIIYMTAECLGLEYNMIECDLFKGENKTEEYLKLNIQHSIPTLVDGKTILNESRVAAAYLVNKYGKDDKLYPKDPETRAMVDQMLYFDMGVLYKAYGEVMYPQIQGKGKPEDDKYERCKEVMGWLEHYLGSTGFVAGTENMTIADVAILASVSTFMATEHFDLAAYEKVNAWCEKIKAAIPNYEKANGAGATAFGEWFKKAVQK